MWFGPTVVCRWCVSTVRKLCFVFLDVAVMTSPGSSAYLFRIQMLFCALLVLRGVIEPASMPRGRGVCTFLRVFLWFQYTTQDQ
uniref:Uncharacterized protein n=2 Tax=Anguilla anguilla TaxID=7936 RepID=A0A0E9SA16_ANGAN